MANKFLNGIDTTSLSVNSQYSLPTSDGSNGQVLKTDGSGNVTFADGADSGYVFYTVKNSTGSTIAKGTGVYASGTDGNSGHILISPMVADGTIEPKYFIGITKDAITNGSTGQVVHFGEISQINTSTYTDGDVLWCDPANDGGFTTTEPAGPNLKLAVAIVINASTNGKIRVRVQGNEGLHELHDVNISSQANGDLLQWNATSGVWENKTLASIADARYVNVSGDTMTGNLYVTKNNVGVNTSNGSYTGFTLESTDSHIDLISSEDGTWGSAINFVEGASITANTDVWSIARQTTGGSGDSSLTFNFGTNNVHNNTTRVKFTSGGAAEFNSSVTADSFKTLSSSTDFSIITRNSAATSFPLYVQNVKTETDSRIARFAYGDAAAGTGTEVLNIGGGTSYFLNTVLGIGTSTPNEELDVRGSVFTSISVTSDRKTTDDYIGSFAFYGGNDATPTETLLYARMMAQMTNVSNGSESGEILFQTANNGSYIDSLRINSNGNLDVLNDVTANHYFADTHFRSLDTNVTLSTTGAGTVYLRPNGYNQTTGQLYIGSNGDINASGIHTAKAYRTDATSTDYSLITRDSAAANFALYVNNGQSGTDSRIARFAYNDTAANSGTEVLNVGGDKSYFNNTDLGIRVTDPEAALHVNGNIILGDTSTTGDARITFYDQDDTDYLGRAYINYNTLTDIMTIRARNADVITIDNTEIDIVGFINMQTNRYFEANSEYALNLNNSDIVGLNGLYFLDNAENSGEGINFYRSATTFDTLRASGGVLYFAPNRTSGSASDGYTVLHSGNHTDYTDSKYIRSNADDSTTGIITFENGIRIGTGSHGTSANTAAITFGEGTPTTDSMYLEYDGEGLSGDNNALFIRTSKDGSTLATFKYGGDIVLDSNNWSIAADGTFTGNGSGLSGVNATLLDSINSSQFLRSDESDTTTGRLTIQTSGDPTIGGTTPTNGYLVLTNGTQTLGFDTNEIHSTDSLYIGTNSGNLGLRPDGAVLINTTTATGDAKLIVNGFLSTGSSAAAQIDGFVRIREQIFIHDDGDTSKAGRIGYSDGFVFDGENGSSQVTMNGQLRLMSSPAISFQNIGSGTYNQAVIYNETGYGFLLEGAWATDAQTTRLPVTLTWRGGFSQGGLQLNGNTQLVTNDTGLGIDVTNPQYNLDTAGTVRFGGHIVMPYEHLINYRFGIADRSGEPLRYILLCANAGGNDVNGTITMDRTSGLRHACRVDIIVSAGSSLSPVGGLYAHGVAGAGEPEYRLVTLTYNSNSWVALEISNPDGYYESSGAYFTGRINSSLSGTFTELINTEVSSVANFESNSRHSIQGDAYFRDGEIKLTNGSGNAKIIMVRENAANTGNNFGAVEFRNDSGVTRAGVYATSTNGDASAKINLYAESGVQIGLGDSDVDSYLRIGGDNVAGGRLYLEYNGDSSYIDCYGGHGGTARYRDMYIRARELYLKGSNGNGLYIDEAGQVGILSTNPQYDLQIGDYTYSGRAITLTSTNNSSSYINFFDNNNTEGSYIKSTGDVYGGDLYFGARWDDYEDKAVLKMRQTSAGATYDVRLGIGTTDPFKLVEFKDNYNGSQLTLRSTSGNSGNAGLRFSIADNTVTTDNYHKASIWLTGDGTGNALGDLTFNISNVANSTNVGSSDERMRLKRNGALLIGTTSAGSTSAKLLVDNYLDSASSAIAQFNGFLRIRDSIFLHQDSNIANQVRLQCIGSQQAVFNGSLTISTQTANTAHIKLNIANAGSPQIEMSDYNDDNYWAVGADDADNFFKIHGSTTSMPTLNSIGTGAFLTINQSGTLTMTGDVIAYSDERLKENVQTIDGALDKVLSMRGVYYNRTDLEDKRRKVGVIAQEVEKVLPEVVSQYSEDDDTRAVDYGKMVGVLIEAIKEQQKQIDELKAMINGST